MMTTHLSDLQKKRSEKSIGAVPEFFCQSGALTFLTREIRNESRVNTAIQVITSHENISRSNHESLLSMGAQTTSGEARPR